MTSKFAPLTKLKKEQLEEVRRLLLQANLYIQNLEKELLAFEQDLINQKPPASGAMVLFSQFTALTQACHDQIIRKKDQIYYAHQERHKVQDQVKAALLEFEKFNYLQIEEEKAYALKIKKQEALMLDEVAIMGYNANKTS